METICILNNDVFNFMANVTEIDSIFGAELGEEDRGEAFFLFHKSVTSGYFTRSESSEREYLLKEPYKSIFNTIKKAETLWTIEEKNKGSKSVYIGSTDAVILEKSKRDKRAIQLNLVEKDELGDLLNRMEIIPLDKETLQQEVRFCKYDLRVEIKGMPVSTLVLKEEDDKYVLKNNLGESKEYNYSQFCNLMMGE